MNEAVNVLNGKDTLAQVVAKDLNNRAARLSDDGMHDEALVLFQSAFRIYTKAFGTKHSSTLSVMRNIDILYERMGY